MTAITAGYPHWLRPRLGRDRVVAFAALLLAITLLAGTLMMRAGSTPSAPDALQQPTPTSQPEPRAPAADVALTVFGLDEPSEVTESVGWCITDPLEVLRDDPNLRGSKYAARSEDMAYPYSELELKALKQEFVERLGAAEAATEPEPCLRGIKQALQGYFAQVGLVNPASLSDAFASPYLHLVASEEQITANLTVFDRNSGELVDGGTVMLQPGELVWWIGTDSAPIMPVMRYVGGDVLEAQTFSPFGEAYRELDLFTASKPSSKAPATTVTTAASTTTQAADTPVVPTSAPAATSTMATTAQSTSTTGLPATTSTTTKATTTTQAAPRVTGSLACKDGTWHIASLSPAVGQGGITRYTDNDGNPVEVGRTVASAPNGTAAIVIMYYWGTDGAGVMQITSNGQTCPAA